MKQLSKSKYAKYCQCPKCLWMSVYKPEEEVVDPSSEARFENGTEVGDLAMGLLGEYVDVTTNQEDGRLDLDRLEEMKRAVGKKRLVLDLSCRRRQDGSFAVVTDRWQKFTELTVTPDNLRSLSAHCDEFLIHAADVEGKRGGIQEDLTAVLGKFCLDTGFPVTYAGGVHKLSDLSRIAGLSGGRLDVTVGSALRIFGGDLDLEDLAAAAAAAESCGGPVSGQPGR